MVKKRRQLKVLVGLTCVFFLAFVVSFLAFLRADEQLAADQQRRLISFELADELRQTSDDLTRMVRTYVLTGDALYKAHYQEILDIRNGIKPRPEKYSRIYWDLVLSDDKRPTDMGSPVSQLQLMQQAGFTQTEFDKLKNAKEASDELTRTEFTAMALIEGAAPPTDQARLKASRMLTDSAYHQHKARIMGPISEFEQLVDLRTRTQIQQSERNKRLLLALFVLLGSLVFLSLAKLVGLLRLERIAAERGERLFKAVFNNAAVGLAQVSTTGTFLQINQQFCDIIGYTREEVTSGNFTFQQVTVSEDLDDDLAYVSRVLDGAGDNYDIEKRYIRKDGRVVWVHLFVCLQRDASGKPDFFISAVIDITATRLARDKLQKLSRMYAALSRCNEAIIRCNNEEELFSAICQAAVDQGGIKFAWIGLVDSNTREVRPAAKFGSGVEYLEGLRITVIENDSLAQGPSGTAIREDQPYWCQDFMHDPRAVPWRERAMSFGWRASASLPIHRNGAVIGAIAVYTDVSDAFDEETKELLIKMSDNLSYALDAFAGRAERDRFVQALLESESKFRALSEESFVGSYIIQDGCLTYVNPRAAAIFGYSRAEIDGLPMRKLIDEDDWEKAEANIRERLMGVDIPKSSEYKARRKDGSEIVIEAQSAVIQTGGRTAVMGMVLDVTERRRSSQMITDYVARIERMILGTVDAISSMVELRDPYTAGHELRVGQVASAIAAEMGLDENVQRGLRIAGAVHDVGKIAIPAEILGMPRRLTELEYEMVKYHPEQGYEILSKIDSPWPIAEVARQHHERMDGTGYPQGLIGEEILLEARIMAVADVVESMTSDRPYRAGLGIDAALGEIERNTGKFYDPNVAQACMRLFREKGYLVPT